MKYKFIYIFLWFTIVNKLGAQTAQILPGNWRATIITDGGELPFHLQIVKKADGKNFSVSAINGAEKLKLDDLQFASDSIIIPIDIFDAKIIAHLKGNKMVGRWTRFVGGDKYLQASFHAQKSVNERFKLSNSVSKHNVSGKWATSFVSKDKLNSTEAVGIFTQKGTKVLGTFLTTTGDYRYLEGVMDGDSLKLSTFDGTHLYLFKAKKSGNTISGQFWSNIHNLENWTAKLDPKAELPDLNKLTYLKPGYNKIKFAFPDTKGNKINIEDDAFKNKVKVVQILGTWCPNCMDESKYLGPWYDKNKARGVEIIGLSYEKSTDLAESGPKIDKMKARFGVNYPVLLAGSKNAGEAAKTLPMLNTVLGFPTTIIIDKKGAVRQIHTGFSGPGTGKYYEEWVQEFNSLIDKLLAEN
jgi:peroxiredoxin